MLNKRMCCSLFFTIYSLYLPSPISQNYCIEICTGCFLPLLHMTDVQYSAVFLREVILLLQDVLTEKQFT